MDEPIMHADRKARNQLYIVALIIVVLATVLLTWVTPMFKRYITVLYQNQQIGQLITVLRLVELAMVLVFLGFIPFVVKTFRTGQRIRREQRFPLPDMKVVSDTPILEGPEAVRHARIYFFLSGFTLLISIGGIITVHILLNRLIPLF